MKRHAEQNGTFVKRSTVGRPVEGVGILITVDANPDTFATVLNVTGNMAATMIVVRGRTDSSLGGESQRNGHATLTD